MKRDDKKHLLMNELRKNPRATLTEMSKKLDIPISTLYDYLNDIKKKYALFGHWRYKECVEGD